MVILVRQVKQAGGTMGEQQARLDGAETFRLGATARRFLLATLLLLIAARLMLIFWLPVIDPTEGRYIEIARKMLETGDWITPQFDYGVPFWGKPPLHTWLSALGMKLFGVSQFGGRILIFATALATGWLCHDWVRRHWGRDLALLSVVAIAAALVFFGASAFVATDMAMVFGTTLSMVAFFNCVTATENRRIWGNLLFVGLAVGMLAKGPTAVVLTGIPLFFWLLLGNRWALLLRLPWGTGLAVLVLLTAPWYVAAELKTPGFLRYFIIGEHYERFVVPGWEGDLYGRGHARPKGLIWAYGLAFFLPWTFFGLALLAKPVRLFAAAKGLGGGAGMYLLLWALSPMILFTPAANILPSYVLPSIPAAAILVVLLCSAVWQGGRILRLATAATLVATLAVYLGLAGLAYFAPMRISANTELALVAKARALEPQMPIIYWGARAFSGEFYSNGRAQSTSDAAVLAGLAANTTRDAVAVLPEDLAQVQAILGDSVSNEGQFGARFLLVEPANGGAGQ